MPKPDEELRKTEIAFLRKLVEKGKQTLPAGGVENLEEIYEPVFFDPDRSFAANDQPTDYIPGLRTWSDTYKQHVEYPQTACRAHQGDRCVFHHAPRLVCTEPR